MKVFLKELFEQGEYAKCINAISMLSIDVQQGCDYKLLQGHCLYELGRYDESVRLFTQVINSSICPEKLVKNAIFNRGMAYREQKKYELAIEDFGRVQSKESMYMKGECYSILGKHKEAKEIFLDVDMCEETDTNALYYYAYYCEMEGDECRALKALISCVKLGDAGDAVFESFRTIVTGVEDVKPLIDLLKSIEGCQSELIGPFEREVRSRIHELEKS